MAWGTPTSIDTTVVSPGGSTIALTVGAGGVPAGALIVVGICEQSPSATGTSIVDTAGNTYTLTTAVLNDTIYGRFAYCSNCLALVNTDSITYTRNASQRAAISGLYVTGEETISSPLDNAVTASASGTSTTPSVTSGAPAFPGELIIGLLCNGDGNKTFTLDTSGGMATALTEAKVSSGTSGAQVDSGYLVNTGVGAKTCNGTWSASCDWVAQIIGFKEKVDLWAASVM